MIWIINSVTCRHWPRNFLYKHEKKNSIHGQYSSIHTIFTGSYNKLGSVDSLKYLSLVIWNVFTNKTMFSYQALECYVLSLFSHYIDLYGEILFLRQLHVKLISSTLSVDAPIFKKCCCFVSFYSELREQFYLVLDSMFNKMWRDRVTLFL